MRLAQTLLDAARRKNLMLVTAESCTGGMVGAAITDIAGSSAIFDRAFITYTNAAKMQMLGVSDQTLREYGAVSEPVASEMAQGALRHSDGDIAVSITGIAGPGGSEHKPEGRVCFGIATKDDCTTQTIEFGPRGRASVRTAATQHALSLLYQAVIANRADSYL
ncbi:MAG: CinA family protein [Pseudomonadota bacterium]